MFQETADALLEKGIKIKITTQEKKFWQRKPREKIHEFELKPLCLGSLIKISKIILKIDPELFKNEFSIQELTFHFSDTLGRDISRIVAIAIVNSKDDPTEELIDLIENNLTSNQLLQVFKHILELMDVSSFMSSIILIKGTNLLKKMNPTEQRS